MKTIIIISDSHGNNNAIKKILSENFHDISVCAGDYETDLNFIKENFTYHVKGNNDFDENNTDVFFEVDNIKFFLQHGHLLGNYSQLDNKEYMKKFLKLFDVDVIIHGHTHINKIEKIEKNKFIINPGSITYPRGNSKASFIICRVFDHNIEFEIKEI
ncbi:MAG: metallophosphoesterase family protein [Metamycoplasmataceae bacterium]